MIQNETEFLAAAKRRHGLNEEMLQFERAPAFTTDQTLLDEWRKNRRTFLSGQLAAVQVAMDEYDARVNGDRRGEFMSTRSGARFWPLDPRPGDFDIEDIAHGLARICRFNGRTKGTYSVGQHSVLVSRLLPDRLKLFGLMHDASEAYLGDIISPVKKLVASQYGPLEAAVMVAVAQRYGFIDQWFNKEDHDLVKEADLVMLVTEARDVTTFGFIPKPLKVLPRDERITDCWSPETASLLFIREFEELTSGAGAVGG